MAETAVGAGTSGRVIATVTEHAATTYLPSPVTERKGVALCLSGGGFRAALFHLGALRRLNEYGLLSRVDTISSVSGGSVLSAHLADKIRPWPQAGAIVPDWEQRVAAPFRKFTSKNLRTLLPLLGLLQQAIPIFANAPAAEMLAKRYEQRLTPLCFADLPSHPRFIFCATDLEFGVAWVFDSGGNRFGDYQVGYVSPPPSWPLGRITAASSCFPPFFGPLPADIDPARLVGGRYAGNDRIRLVKSLRLTDGGVYDNLGLEPVWKDHLTVIVSDGGGIFDPTRDTGFFWRMQRYAAVMMHQDLALRIRWLISSFIANQLRGTYWGITSETAHYGTQLLGYPPDLVRPLIAYIRTDLDVFSIGESCVLENHGYLVADAAVKAHLVGQLPIDPALPVKIPHPDWMDEQKVRQALAGSARSTFWGRT